jgi:hypothetical protein
MPPADDPSGAGPEDTSVTHRLVVRFTGRCANDEGPRRSGGLRVRLWVAARQIARTFAACGPFGPA